MCGLPRPDARTRRRIQEGTGEPQEDATGKGEGGGEGEEKGFLLPPSRLCSLCLTSRDYSDACPVYLCLSAYPLATCPHRSETTTTIRVGREREKAGSRTGVVVVGRVAVAVRCCDCSRIRSATAHNRGAWACAAVARGEEEAVSRVRACRHRARDRSRSGIIYARARTWAGLQDRHARVAAATAHQNSKAR